MTKCGQMVLYHHVAIVGGTAAEIQRKFTYGCLVSKLGVAKQLICCKLAAQRDLHSFVCTEVGKTGKTFNLNTFLCIARIDPVEYESQTVAINIYCI